MLKTAVIGAGNMGRNHIRAYADLETVELVGVADADRDAVRRATRSYRVSIYDDYRELLDDQRPDLVSVAVPTEFHASVACETLGRGIHTLVEKPLALTTAEGQRIIDTATQNGAQLMVGHIERFNPAIVELQRRLAQQELGRVFQVHARRLSPFPQRVRDVGVVLDLATHDIDIMRYLVGSEVERAYAETERKAHANCEDLLSGLLRFGNGVVGVLDVNWLTPTKVRQLSVTGEGGMYLVDYLTQDVYWYKNSSQPAGWEALSVLYGEGDMVKVHFAKKEPLRAELEAFVQAILTGREPRANGYDGLIALDLAHRLIESGRRHAPVDCRPVGDAAADVETELSDLLRPAQMVKA
jgi:predicted dehydrogenase